MTTFYKWLKRYSGPRWVRTRGGGAAVGDFRADVLSDDEWPREATTRKEIDDYLTSVAVNACERAIRASRIAWQLFRDAHPRRRPRKAVRALRSVSLTTRFHILKRDGYRCGICGASAADGARLEVDHKVALSRGGTNYVGNLWTLCFECNRGKNASSL